MTTDNIDDIPKWSMVHIFFVNTPKTMHRTYVKEEPCKRKDRILMNTGSICRSDSTFPIPWNPNVRSWRRPHFTLCIRVQPRSEASSRTTEVSGHNRSIFPSWLGTVSPPTFGYTRLAGSSDTDATRCLCTLTISCIMGILEARRLGRIVETT